MRLESQVIVFIKYITHFRASYEPGGRTFESCRARHLKNIKKAVIVNSITAFFMSKIYTNKRLERYFGIPI